MKNGTTRKAAPTQPPSMPHCPASMQPRGNVAGYVDASAIDNAYDATLTYERELEHIADDGDGGAFLRQ